MMTMSLKVVLAACLLLATTCQAGDVAEIERRLMEAAESPDAARLMEWLYSLNDRDGRLELPKDTKDLVACTVCTDALNVFLTLLRPPIVSLEELNQALKNVCTELNILSEPACDGIIDNYAPILEEVYITQEVDGGVLCAILLGEDNCIGVEGAELEDWNVAIDGDVPPVEDKVMPEDGMPTMKVLHISDIHFDPTYKVGSSAQCADLGMCCTESSGDPQEGERAAGYWGDYSCDLPEWTMRNVLEHIRDEQDTADDPIDFILLTGDFPAHDMWYQGKVFNVDTAGTAMDMVKEIFPNTKVFPSLGNHEAFPGNIYATGDAVPAEYEMSWLYDGLATYYAYWVPEEDLETFKVGGYYATNMADGLKFISVNSLFAYTMNFWLGLEYVDPMDQLKWLHDELLLSEQAGEKVWILSHLPTGNGDCMSTWGREYTEIIERFENTVVNQFFGHTHNDEFKVFYDAAGNRPTSFGFVTPSVTPYTNTNLAYRIYTVDGDYAETTWRVLDYDTFIGDLSTAGADADSPMEYRRLYNVKESLHLENLLPADYDDLVVRLRDDDALFTSFFIYYNSDYDGVEDQWTERDREDILCGAVTTDRANDSKCQELFSGTTTEPSSATNTDTTTVEEDEPTTTSGGARMSFLFW